MFKSFLKKIKESVMSVMPIFAIVLVLWSPLVSFVDLKTKDIIVFAISTVFLIVGMALFNVGADMAMSPMGEMIGTGLTRTKKLGILMTVSFLLGVLITIAEPDLTVLAEQVGEIMNGTVLIAMVGIGVGLMLVISILKIVFNINLVKILLFCYMMMFGLAAILLESGRGSLLAVAFDSGGVTTGPLTVPFIMALGVGISATVGGYYAKQNSFGLISLCSVGPILCVMLLSLTSKGEIDYTVPDYPAASANAVLGSFLGKMKEVGLALALIVVAFLILQFLILKLPKKKLFHIGLGIILTFAGLVIFLTSVSIGYMPVGYEVGRQISSANKWVMTIFGLIMGMVVVLAEPAVHVLKHQVEEITAGAVSKRSMTISLSIGVGVSIGLSVIRTIFNFSILYYVVPGYLISLLLALFVPRIYTAIAFDSGGVASGPMTSGFILPLMIGMAEAMHGGSAVLNLAFGVVAMVAMTPLITIQVLGFRSIVAKHLRQRILIKRIVAADDEQIIYFNARGEKNGK